MKCSNLKFFWNKMLLEQAINLSLILESSHIRDCLHLHETCQHLLVWRDEMGFLEWVHGINPPPCPCVSPKCSSMAVLRLHSHSHGAALHQGTSLDVALERDTWTTQCHCYELWEQFRMQNSFQSLLQLVWLVRHKPGKIPVHNKPPTYGKNGGCWDSELPQPSWEFPVKRWHHQKWMHRESTRTYECEVQKVNGPALFFPSPKYIKGKTPSSHKAKETKFLKIEVSFRRDTNPYGWGCANKE